MAGESLTPPAGAKAADLADISFAAAAATKQAAPTITVGSITISPDGNIAIPLSIANAAPFAGCNFVLTFPTSIGGLQFVEALLGDIFAEKDYDMGVNVQIDGDKGMLMIAISGAENLATKAGTTVADLRFNFMGIPLPSIPINLPTFNMTDVFGFSPRFTSPQAPNKENGGITVQVGEGEGEGEGEGIIIDHTCTDITQVPDTWIGNVKSQLRVHYAHTSHGSQITTGLERLWPGFSEHVTGYTVYSPERYTQEFGLKPFVFGVSPTRNQFRFPVRTPIPNLLCVGDSVQPDGPCVPQSMESGIAGERIVLQKLEEISHANE